MMGISLLDLPFNDFFPKFDCVKVLLLELTPFDLPNSFRSKVAKLLRVSTYLQKFTIKINRYITRLSKHKRGSVYRTYVKRPDEHMKGTKTPKISLLKIFIQVGTDPVLVTYNLVINGYCLQGSMHEAKMFFFHDQRKKVAYVVLSCTGTLTCKMKLLTSYKKEQNIEMKQLWL